ncbi:hypothetical protein BCON_0280g00060 [Botryotinia convoluta]|uniref:Uncharacterized protein n=1 Tax=Botryotinia convoluta TaxID=54673 RepID=A0A4Z1HEG7_9HELO|nr:hypothetical protein BCON_0280g00060 [Botryotinia convoluta]
MAKTYLIGNVYYHFDHKDLLGFVQPNKTLEEISISMNGYKTRWNPRTLEYGMYTVIETLRGFTDIQFREDVKYEDEEHNKVKWGDKYSTEVYEILKQLAPFWDYTKPRYVPEIRAATPGVSNDENAKEGATVVRPPSPHDSANRRGTSASKQASGPQQKKARKPEVPSKSRSIAPKEELAHRPIDGNLSGKSDNIKNVKSSAASSSTVKPPVAQSSAASSSTAKPPTERGRPSSSSTNSASKPPKTGNGGSSRTPHHGQHSRSGETARKTATRTLKAEKEEK